MPVVRSMFPIIFSERYRGTRYYGGDRYIDITARLCRENILEALKFDPAIWRLNVQLFPRFLANFEVSTAPPEPHEKCATFFQSVDYCWYKFLCSPM
ncbi:hypothetical protein H5410_042128 [Solanum commersonii]|uniref:Serine hydroxymethyltransferase-like domain-containing protein n=1 Tax=Solanum commersonii TaxID=4109 RepID=A0A9J5XXK8_SOLCO|nr:hypothetical protein H5410_042128 [Solanum commersonii]